jgi:AcrR family transcriptional regulator
MLGFVASTAAPARTYRSPRRAEQAASTRTRVLQVATGLFLERGWAGTAMRAVAEGAGVSVATVELQFGTKAALLQAAIDVAIAGDDVPVPVLERDWADRAAAAPDARRFLALVADVLGPAQQRSAGLVLAVLEGASTDPRLGELAERLAAQRLGTATWIVRTLATKQPLRPDLAGEVGVETLWALMDPAVFDRLVRYRRWSVADYQGWFARSAASLLLPDHPPPEGAPR